MLIATCTYTLTDGKGKTSQVRFHTNIAADNVFGFGSFNSPFEDACDYFQEIGRRIDLLCKGRLTSIDLSTSIPLPDVKPSPAGDADVEEIALFDWFSSETGSWKNSLPAFNHDLFGVVQTVLALDVEEIAYFTELIGNATGAEDWPAEIGGITDARGAPVGNDNPTVHKRFRR